MESKEKQMLEHEKVLNSKLVDAQNTINSLSNNINALDDDVKRKAQALSSLEAEYKEKSRSVFVCGQ